MEYYIESSYRRDVQTVLVNEGKFFYSEDQVETLLKETIEAILQQWTANNIKRFKSVYTGIIHLPENPIYEHEEWNEETGIMEKSGEIIGHTKAEIGINTHLIVSDTHRCD